MLPRGALERVKIGSIHLSPRWGFRTGKAWFYTPHAACHTRMLPRGALERVKIGSIHLSPRWGFRTGKDWFLYTFRPAGALERVKIGFYTPFAPLGL